MRRSCFLLLLSPLALAACGVGVSQSEAGKKPPPIEDSGPPADSGECSSSPIPEPQCTDCTGNPVAPGCIDGEWECPSFGCPLPPPPQCPPETPACAPDCAGNPVFPDCVNGGWVCETYECSDAGCGPVPPALCPVSTLPCAPYWTLECTGAGWSCIEHVPDCPDDASAPDAPPPPPPFACGNVGCDPSNSYCEITADGPVLDDGGNNSDFYCIPLPSSCNDGEATCACIQAVQGIGCGCVESAGDVTITCEIQ